MERVLLPRGCLRSVNHSNIRDRIQDESAYAEVSGQERAQLDDFAYLAGCVDDGDCEGGAACIGSYCIVPSDHINGPVEDG